MFVSGKDEKLTRQGRSHTRPHTSEGISRSNGGRLAEGYDRNNNANDQSHPIAQRRHSIERYSKIIEAKLRRPREKSEGTCLFQNGGTLNHAKPLDTKSGKQAAEGHIYRTSNVADRGQNPNEGIVRKGLSCFAGLLRNHNPSPEDIYDGSQAKRAIRKHMKEGQSLTANEIRTGDLTVNDVIIAVMGPTGTGKTSFINNLTGYGGNVGHGLETCTSGIEIIELCDRLRKSKLIMVDTPGFDDTNKSETEVLDMIASWLQKTYQRNIKLAGIIYLHRITDNRMAGTPLKNLRMFEKLCGKHALQNVVLSTTMWDDVTEEIGIDREGELKSNYWKAMLTQGSRTFRYQGTRESAWSIIDHFLNDTPMLALQLQKELVDLKRQLPETQAGAESYALLEGLVLKQQETLNLILSEQRSHADDNELSNLREELQDQRKQTESVIRSMERLHVRDVPHRLLHILSRPLY